MTHTQFNQAVLAWFDQHGRHDLPWQQDKSAYHTWVSEIMLQQTQVSTVIPYFQRFMQRFPDVHSLAEAEQDEVLHHWTGLGYYARARNLHKTARIVSYTLAGEFPQSVTALEELPGIGRSTAGAILSIATGQRAVILDGNVKRVLARYYALSGWPGSSANQKKLWHYAEQLTPQQRAGDYTQAMMDLGAILCTRSKPSCLLCPVQPGCQAYQQGQPTAYPQPKPKKVLPTRQTTMLLLHNPAGHILLQQRPPSGIWGGLWCLPEVADLRDAAATTGLTLDLEHAQALPPLRHTFSHFHLQITPVRIPCSPAAATVMEGGATLWYNRQQPANIGLAAPTKRLLHTDTQPLASEGQPA